MFKKLNPGTKADAKAAPVVRPLIEYLQEQNKLLDEIGRVLSQENKALSGRDAEAINELSQKKSKLMLTLQQNDQKIKLHPDAAKLKTDFVKHVQVLKLKLAECKRRNEVNGRLIRLCQSSCRRLSAVLMGVRDKMTKSMTYTDKGGISANGLQRLNIQA